MAAKFKIDTSKPLGSGSYGTVFTGTMMVNRRTTPVAVKRIPNDGKGNHFCENAEKEYNILKSFDEHRNIVKLLQFKYNEDFIYIYMELGDRGNLEEFLNQCNPDMQLKVRIMNDCASALSYMHGRSPSIIHRDIKPANVIIQTDGTNYTAKLVDFGLSKIFQKEDHFFMSTNVGTLAYRAPELFIRGRKQYTPSIDIFSMGLLNLVVFNFDGIDGFVEPTPAHIKHQPFLPYGQRLLQAKDENSRAPELFTEFTEDPWPQKDLKIMITSMVCFHPSERTDMAVVETLLSNITKVFQAQRATSKRKTESTSREVQQLTRQVQQLQREQDENIQLINELTQQAELEQQEKIELTQQAELEQQEKSELREELSRLRQQTAADVRPKTREVKKATQQTGALVRKQSTKNSEATKVTSSLKSPAHVYQHTSGVRVELVQADMTTLTSDAVVIFSKADLSPIGAVATAVHRAAGKAGRRECEEALARHGGGMKLGDVVVTSAGRLPWKHIIYCVTYRYVAPDYEKVLQEAVSRGCKSVAVADGRYVGWYYAVGGISSYLAKTPRHGLQVISLVSQDSDDIQRWRQQLDEQKKQGKYT